MDLDKYFKEVESRIHGRTIISKKIIFDAYSKYYDNLFKASKFQEVNLKSYLKNYSFAMSKIHEFNNFLDIKKDVKIRNYNKYYNDYVNYNQIKDLTENNFIQTSNKLTSQENREKTEFNLFTEIVLKVCEKNKSWLTNCLFTSNPNNKRHE